jgi:hypothetical protein
MSNYEKPFEYLKRKDGSAFSPEIVRHWYEARAYTLDKLKEINIGPESNQHLHAVVTSDSPLMLSVVRQIALLGHYANFDETTGENRTLITLVSHNPLILEELKKEEYLSNLPDYCKYTIFGGEPVNKGSYLDIELEIVEEWHEVQERILIISEEDVKTILSPKTEKEVYSINTSKAVLADRIYVLGTLIDDLPAEDIHCASRYALALDAFEHILQKQEASPLVNPQRWETDQTSVRNGLSSIFCADCFEQRIKCLSENNIEAYSKSEHARWVAEKLIMGFRPLNKQERIHDERLFNADKRNYRKKLKKSPSDPVHLDLLSNAELRRIDPDSMKYDTFLMLAIPKILQRVRSASSISR